VVITRISPTDVHTTKVNCCRQYNWTWHVQMLWCLFVFFWSRRKCTDVIRIACI